MIIKDGITGLLFDVDNPKSLAETIKTALNNKEKMRQISDHGREYAKENFDIKEYARKIQEIYRDLLNIQNDELC